MTFTASPRGPGLGSSATHSTRVQGPASREKNSPGMHVLTYHPPPGASAKRYPRAAHPAENTGNVSPLSSRGMRRTSNSSSPSLATTWWTGIGRPALTSAPSRLAGPHLRTPVVLVVMQPPHCHSYCMYVIMGATIVKGCDGRESTVFRDGLGAAVCW